MAEITITAPLVPPNPSGLCMCGCGGLSPIAKMTNRRQGCIAGHSQRFILGHQGRLRNPYTVNDSTGCWEWCGYIDEHGYGRAGVGSSRSKQAHIVYYERAFGVVPEGLELDHTCQNKRCVNPGHLEPVTHLVNVRRQRQVKLSLEIAEQIRREFVPSPYGGRRGGNIAAMSSKFGVGRSQIYRIIKGQSWTR